MVVDSTVRVCISNMSLSDAVATVVSCLKLHFEN